jgi:hypothetical protein
LRRNYAERQLRIMLMGPKHLMLGNMLADTLSAIGIQKCGGCGERQDLLNRWGVRLQSMATIWAYGITTIAKRRKTLLPRTIASLKVAGFDKPMLFVDGDKDASPWEAEFKLETVARPKILVYGNWVLSLAELFIRRPNANRFAIFQDDFVTMPGLRDYLNSCQYPEDGYWNLYTFPENLTLTKGLRGWHKSNQYGKGAVALVFDRDTVRALLTHQHIVDHSIAAKMRTFNVDGAVVSAMKKAGKFEYIHNPSLVQHTGLMSTRGGKVQPLADSFPGENVDIFTEMRRS